jgi:hypothetical protein
MKRALLLLTAAFIAEPSLHAQDWSLGIGSGAFVFGDFLERNMRPVNSEGPEDAVTLTLSADTRPGLAVDVERTLGDRWAVRLEGTFTRAPLSVRQVGSEGTPIEAGELDVSTFVLPVIFRINRDGTFRFHLAAGPAMAMYRYRGRQSAAGSVPLFRGTRNESGIAFGGGVSWMLSERFAIEGNITDTITTSPFRESDLPNAPGISTPKPHNVHTTVGVRWGF